MAEYTFDLAWERERARVGAGELLFDAFTTHVLAEDVGVAEHWECLEVGAGGGTITSWLCERVGPGGRVLAIDLDTRFVERLEHPNLTVRQHDIGSGPPEPDRAYDLVHARLVLEHVPTRSQVVEMFAGMVKPGGWVMLEDVDLTTQPHLPPEAYFQFPSEGDAVLARATAALCDVLRDFGVELEYGRELPGELLRVGLEDVDARYQTRLVRGGTPRAEYTKLMFTFLRDPIVERGYLTGEEFDAVIERHEDPGYAFMSVPLVSAWGRKPRE
ncbi:MAG TPA: methyltransferase domain-containing protein [Solirubrobacteraceae bacterium]|nr:methyltransferase domain-containing protein [Solirubrobacteraceae bacterium]